MHSGNESPTTTLTIPDVSFPGWEVLHVYQHDADSGRVNTILLLRRTGSMGEALAVGKILTLSKYYRTVDGIQNEADALAKIPPHPSIIKLYSTHINEPRPGQQRLMLEFCAGEDVESLCEHAQAISEQIPESFFWHVLHQALLALDHLDLHDIRHGDMHGRNLFLRPVVAADLYPDVVLADFEYADYYAPDDERGGDREMLGKTLRYYIFARPADASRYSPALCTFVDTLSGMLAPARGATDLLLLARESAARAPAMPEWMTAYFSNLRAKAVPPRPAPGHSAALMPRGQHSETA